MSDTLVFIPSFDRPMQLDATLKTFYKYCKDAKDCDVHVLYRTSNERYESGYKTLKSTHFMSFFDKETRFKDDLIQLIHDKTYILFIVDDCIFTRPFDLEKCKYYIDNDPEAIGFSLRLGKNTIMCYPTKSFNEKPQEINLGNTSGSLIEAIDWTKVSNGDFGYPLEVSSSLYRVSVIDEFINNDHYNNPNDLEWIMACGAVKKRELTDLFFYETSVAFCNPINKVQKVNNNRTGNDIDLSPESLLKKFEDGCRIDVDVYDGFISNGCHQEVFIKYVNEE